THGILLSRRMHRPLARRLAREGFRVVTLDLLGHGGSDRPTESWQYSMTSFAEQVLALLDHLEIERAVVGGTSLGANVTLELAVLAPQRLRGLLVEMPVLDNAVFAGLLAFPPLMFAARFAPITVRGVKAVAKRVPRGYIWVDVLADVLQQDPTAMAALLHGLLFQRIAPQRRLRQQIATPALVIGHARDPIHPFGDADTLAQDMPAAEFIQARSPVELRFDPERLTVAIVDYLHRRFDATAAGRDESPAS
ncbi:MAG: alpha/beta fold hydrolase, partial [Thermocrispum sp.]